MKILLESFGLELYVVLFADVQKINLIQVVGVPSLKGPADESLTSQKNLSWQELTRFSTFVNVLVIGVDEEGKCRWRLSWQRNANAKLGQKLTLTFTSALQCV